MTHKLTPVMTEAITSAYRAVVEGHRAAYHGDHHVVYGLKTNTANALISRGLIRAARVGAFTEYVLTDAGIALADTLTRDAAWRVRIDEQANQAATEDTETDWVDALQADPSASTRNAHEACDMPGSTGCPTGEHADRAPLETVIGTVDVAATIDRLTPVQRVTLYRSAVDDSGTLVRGADGYGTQAVWGGTVATTVALRNVGLVELRRDVTSTRNYHRNVITPVGFMIVAEMIRRGWTLATLQDAVTDARKATPVQQTITAHRDLIIRVHGAVTEVTSNTHVTPSTPIGTVCVVASRGAWRRGVLVAVGRSNATVAYTTVAAMRDNPADPLITIKADRMERVEVVASAYMIHAGTFRESCLSHGCDGCPQGGSDGGDENTISPADLVPGDVADADTDAIDRAERDAVVAMIEAERVEEDVYATEHAEMENATVAALADAYHDAALERDHHGRHGAPRMAVKPRGISPLSARERDARKARRRAQKQARKIARRAGR